MNIDDGGPAFPVSLPNLTGKTISGFANDEIPPECTSWYAGMMARDYFAAKAMQALIAKSNGQDTTGGKTGVPLVAKYAYEYADAMLAERGE